MKVGIGQDSHRFDLENTEKRLVLGGVLINNAPALLGNSDGDVVLHSITNAISGVTCVNILGKVADEMCLNDGITDSKYYLFEALNYLESMKITHVSISIECQTPKISNHIDEMRSNISELLSLPRTCVGITATSGEGLTQFGKGYGIQVFSCITVI
ncbi:MAG: 2-C-methyl-D-erythritol 2,4-cyclodiphosphate synthase [Clostridiales bacterium]